MSAKLVAKYGLTDHLLIYSDSRVTVWKRVRSPSSLPGQMGAMVGSTPRQQRATASARVMALRAKYARRRDN